MADLSGTSLAELQRWFQRMIIRPGTSATGAEDTTTGEVATVITASTRQHPTERLAVYRRGYRLRLLECLRGSFPALHHLLGQQLFEAFAEDYLAACPSRSYTLFRVGERFADHLERTRPDHDRRIAEREAWVDLVIDLTRFERVVTEVYHGPGTETGPVLRGADLPAVTDPTWSELTLRPAPCLRLVTTHYPVHAYAAAVARGGTPALPRAQTSVLAVHRRAYAVLITELTPPADQLLTTLLSGETVATAATRADISPGSAHSVIRRWVEAGFFIAWAPQSRPRSSSLDAAPPSPRIRLRPTRGGESDEHPWP